MVSAEMQMSKNSKFWLHGSLSAIACLAVTALEVLENLFNTQHAPWFPARSPL